MGNFSTIKGAINAAIYDNTTQDITGTVLNTILQSIVTTLGTNSGFMGIATPSTVPATAANVDGKQWYIATQVGVYHATFGGITLTAGDIYLFYCDSTGWHNKNITDVLTSRISNVESSVAQISSSVLGEMCVNMANGQMQAYNDHAAARIAVAAGARIRFMTLKYIYLNSGTPTLREEMYTENQNGDITNDSDWSDDTNWTTIADIAPLGGFIN